MRFIFLGLIALALFSSLAFAQPMAPRAGWQVFNTEIGFADLVSRLEAAVKEENMGLVT